MGLYVYVRVRTGLYEYIHPWHVHNSVMWVQINFYQYVLVCTSTYQYILLMSFHFPVCTGTYAYIPGPIQTGICFTSPVASRRRHNMIQGSTAVCTSTYEYVLVHTEQWHGICMCGMYWCSCTAASDMHQYVLVRTSTYQYEQFCLILSRCAVCKGMY